MCVVFFFFFFKQKTAYEMRISDWSSDVCSSDLGDLYVRDPGRVLRDDGVDVVAVDGEVVEVGQEADVRLPRPVDRCEGVGSGEQGVALGAADRLDEDSASDACRQIGRAHV